MLRAAALLLLLLASALAAAPATPAPRCPPCAPSPSGCSHVNDDPVIDECLYKIDNYTDNLVVKSRVPYYGVICPSGLGLDSRAVPRWEAPKSVARLVVERCGLPAAGTLAEAAGVAPLTGLDVKSAPPGPLRASLLAGLRLTKLYVAADSLERPLVVPEQDVDILASLSSLRNLWLHGVRLPPGALGHLNSSLQVLRLVGCGLTELPTGRLCARPTLKLLTLDEPELVSPPDLAACRLDLLSITAPKLRRLPTTEHVKSLYIQGVQDVRLDGCGSLLKLSVSSLTLSSLPPGWLAGCSRLATLTLRLPALTSLPGDALRSAAGAPLHELTVSGSLTHLEPDVFLHNGNIRVLKLVNNNLTGLPINVFSSLSLLDELDLSRNSLQSPALEALSGLPLGQLALDRNPLGDLCAPPEADTTLVAQKLSPLNSLSRLRSLSLRATGARRLCADWRLYLPELSRLDLSHNNITALEWPDLQWPRRADVDLTGNPLEAVRASADDLRRAARAGGAGGPSAHTVVFQLDEEQALRCDCHVYWAARALRERLVAASFRGLRCQAPQASAAAAAAAVAPPPRTVPLDDIDLEDMTCSLSEDCPAGCSCLWSAADEEARVRCGAQALDAAGTLPGLAALAARLAPAPLVLNASGAGARRLPAGLPASLRALDLRHNALQALPPALLAAPRALLLAHNLLDCGCSSELTLQLRAHLQQVTDLDEAKCADGRWLRAAVLAGCGAGSGLARGVWGGAAGGAACVLAAGLLALLLLRRAVRLRLKAALLARGLCLRWARPADDDTCKYDAFLSYAHEDGAWADELLAALEGGGGGGGGGVLRLCVHHRDWPPGGWIPAQIARSVAESRRTIILLSEHFVRSSWARAEFREAYSRALLEGQARLVVVLLGDAPPAGLDKEMAHYVRNNTYMRWGEPGFWDKLRLALPQPPPPGPAARPRATPAAPAAPPRATPAAPAAPPAPPEPPSPRPPSTPVIKFAQLELPAPRKPPPAQTSPCA